ncbi:MAG TPA: threonine/serine dehydratase [Roseiarcus sp.]|nr:threonine/serine dehydratase [Roseiarcus sp.]
MTLPVAPSAIRQAYSRIAPYIRRTPLLEAASPIDASKRVSLKLEFLQHAGSFKPRGAFNNLLSVAAPAAGVATASGGNHGAAVAYAAGKLGLRARIFVPEIAAPVKIAKIKASGAEVVVKGATYFDALALCDAYVAESGALSIHAYDSARTIEGQGTVALEWEEDLARLALPPLDTVLVAVGGGGLIAGVAAWFADKVKVISVEPEGSRALHDALAAGRPVDVPIQSIAADSLGARRVGDLVFGITQKAVAASVLVSDEAIRAAQKALWRDFCVIAEPGGAAAYAALMSGAYTAAADERVGILLCGGNANLATLAPEREEIIPKQMLMAGLVPAKTRTKR